MYQSADERKRNSLDGLIGYVYRKTLMEVYGVNLMYEVNPQVMIRLWILNKRFNNFQIVLVLHAHHNYAKHCRKQYSWACQIWGCGIIKSTWKEFETILNLFLNKLSTTSKDKVPPNISCWNAKSIFFKLAHYMEAMKQEPIYHSQIVNTSYTITNFHYLFLLP